MRYSTLETIADLETGERPRIHKDPMKIRIHYKFDEAKATEAAVLLLNQVAGKEMDKLRLVKLLYLADRLSLERRLKPITGDVFFCMEHGPVLSRVLNMMSSEDVGEHWSSAIQRDGYQCKATRPHEPFHLSSDEIKMILEVSDRFSGYGTWELRNYTHEHCPEYVETPKGRRKDLPVESIFAALKMSKAEIERATELAALQSPFYD